MTHPTVEKFLNISVNVAYDPDGQFLLQCVDYIDAFGEYIFEKPWAECVGGVEGARNLPNVMPAEYWTWTAYNGTNVPERGSVLIWAGNQNNVYGHTALTLSATRTQLVVAQQDGFTNTRPTHISTLGYYNDYTGHLMGWLIPKDSKIKTKEQVMAKTYRHETKWTTKNQVKRNFYGNFPDKPTGITLHHWGVDGQKFDNVAQFLATNDVPTSAHYVVEDGRVATLAAPEVATFHSGHSTGNGTTIGIELRPECTKGDVDTAVQLIYELEKTYGSMNIYQHKDWAPTACAGRWGARIPEIIDRVNKMHANGGKDPGLVVEKPAPKPTPKPKPAPVKKGELDGKTFTDPVSGKVDSLYAHWKWRIPRLLKADDDTNKRVDALEKRIAELEKGQK